MFLDNLFHMSEYILWLQDGLYTCPNYHLIYISGYTPIYIQQVFFLSGGQLFPKCCFVIRPSFLHRLLPSTEYSSVPLESSLELIYPGFVKEMFNIEEIPYIIQITCEIMRKRLHTRSFLFPYGNRPFT